MKNLKHLREKKRLKLAQLESLTGISKGYLSDMENGKKINPSLDTIQRIAKALEVEVNELIGG